MTEEPKMAKLLEEVLAKTRDGKVRWEPTINEQVFISALGGKFSLVIDASVGIPALTLGDQKGRTLIRVSGEQIHELLELARRSALNTDAVVDSVLESLRKL